MRDEQDDCIATSKDKRVDGEKRTKCSRGNVKRGEAVE